MEQGYLLWEQAVNDSGGLLGRPVRLIILHDDSTPAKVISNYNTLIHQDHVDLLFGPFSSTLTKASAPVAEQADYAFVEGAGEAQSLFDMKLHDLFAVSLPASNDLLTFVYYILSLPLSLRPKTAAYATSDDPFTTSQLTLAQQLLQQGGVRTVFSNIANPYPSEDPNYVTKYIPGVAQQVVASHAQVDILGTVLPDVQMYINIFKKDHYNPRALIATAGPDLGQDFIKAVGGVKYTEGVFVPNGWYPQSDNFENADMVQAYLSKYGGTADEINADVAEGYSVGQVLQQAVEKAQSIDNAKIIAELHSDDVFNTVQGTAQFGDEGQNSQAIAYLFQWQSGQFIPVYPLSVAAQNPEFPKAPNF
jgi:branched-chain amino acid transport system substrate-binding protein